MDRELQRRSVYDSEVLRGSRLDIDSTITQREAQKLNLALIYFTLHISG